MENIKNMLIAFVLLITIISPSYAVINVGTVIFDPPYVISSNQGFEIEFVKAICTQMHQECNFETMEYNRLFAALDVGTIDIAMDNIDFYISSNSLNGNYIYSFPYLLSEGQFLVSKDKGIQSLDNLPKGSKVGLVQEQAQIDQGVFYSFFLNKYKSQFQIVPFNDLDSLITSLSAGQIDAGFLDKGEVSYWVVNENKEFKALGAPMKVADGVGLISLPSKAALMAQVNKAIKELEQNGEYAKLYTTYFGMIPPESDDNNF